MALKKQITLKSNFGDDVVFNDAYIKVENMMGNKMQMRVDVSIHKKANDIVVDRKNYLFTPDLNGKNFIAQAYEYLKTLPDYANATDA
jgi:hypothetical protein